MLCTCPLDLPARQFPVERRAPKGGIAPPDESTSYSQGHFMDHATLFRSRRVGTDTDLLPSYVPLPGLGVLPVNAYLIHAREPVLVDTGMAVLHDDFMGALRQLIDPADLRWIWITHADADHVGNLRAVLAEAPRARIVTNYLGAGKLGLQQLPLDHAYLLNPGQALDVGDRKLLAHRPPVYDAPETLSLFDTRTRHLFSADCFGAVMARPFETASAIPAADLHAGLTLWSSIDAPWLAHLSRAQLVDALRPLHDLAPGMILGSHLPPATGIDDALFEGVMAAREAPPFVGPDQAALERAAQAREAVAH
jgi:glyoxylase-like metal-dependent hydrolase (beta-lactamase superfamily II)